MKRDKVFTAVFAVLAFATCLPIWAGHYLPLLDLPNHLSAIAVWAKLNDPDLDYSKYYTLNLKPLPYWAYYYACVLLSHLFSVETANKLFLTAYAVALPAGALGLARRFGRSPWLSLFVFPLVWNYNLAEGFIAYCAGIAAMAIALVAVDRHCERPTILRGAWIVVIGSSIYFFHLLPYMLFLVCAGLMVWMQREALRFDRLLERSVPVLLCTLVGLWAYKHNAEMGYGAPLSMKNEFLFDSLANAFSRGAGRFLNFLSSSRDEWIVVGLAVSWLGIALYAARTRSSDERPSPRDWALEACLAASLAAVVLLPRSMQRPFNWYMINGRFLLAAALFGALCVRGSFEGRRRWLFAPVAALGLWYAVELTVAVVRFNRHVAGFDEVVAHIPLHRSTLTLSLPPLSDPVTNVGAFNQWPSYTQIRRGGYNFYNFNYGFPLKYKTYKAAPPWNHPDHFNFEQYGAYWDYFLTHNEKAGNYHLFDKPRDEGKVRLVAEKGDWRLWENLTRPPEDSARSSVPRIVP